MYSQIDSEAKSTSRFSDEFTRLLHFLRFVICHVSPKPQHSVFSWQMQHISLRLCAWALELTHTTESDVEIQIAAHFRLSSGFRFSISFRISVRRFPLQKQKTSHLQTTESN